MGRQVEYRHLPFGSPEGESFNLSEAVDLGASLKLPDGGLQVRAFVGWKGAGKTLYLKLHHEAARSRAQADGIYVEPTYSYRMPTTDAIMEFSMRGQPSQVVDRWQTIWTRSALLAAASHLAFAPGLAPRVDSLAKAPDELLRLLRLCGGPVGLYDAFTVVYQHDRATRGRGPLDSVPWNRSTLSVCAALQEAPPISLYADMLDAGFEVDPASWSAAQLGLLKAIGSLLEDPAFGGRLHVTVALRDHTLALLSESEHSTKVWFQPYLKTLDWNYDSLKQLLYERIRSMDERFLVAPDLMRDDPVRSWLGFRKVNNTERGVEESAVGYLIRHTRLTPRDVVVLGNALCAKIDTTDRGSSLNEFDFKRIISDCARRFGSELVMTCSQQIAADCFRQAAQHGTIDDSYWGANVFKADVARAIERALSAVGVDRFDTHGLATIRDTFSMNAIDPDIALAALWGNRMIGIVETDPIKARDRCAFFGSDYTTTTIPTGVKEFVFHPCMIDTLPSLHGIGAEPVILGRGWDVP